MYSPNNQYYQPYTSTSDNRSRRSSVSSHSSSARTQVNNNDVQGDSKSLSPDQRQGVRCCCISFVLILVTVSTVTGILVWVLNRSEVSSLSEVSEEVSDQLQVSTLLTIEDSLSDVESLLLEESEVRVFNKKVFWEA